MDAQILKEKIVEDDKLEAILLELGCHKLKYRNGGMEIRGAMPDGNNPTALKVFIDTLSVTVYTRDDFGDENNSSDIIGLVEYVNNMYFTQAINWLCEVCGYSFYENERKTVEEDPCLTFLKYVEPDNNAFEEDDIILKKLDESILNEYKKSTNIWFRQDGITYPVQMIFELGVSYSDDRLTIPIRDELGNLVGVKGRTTLDLVGEIKDLSKFGIAKYKYIHKCPKGKILFGLDKAFKYIKAAGKVIVFESEKAVMQAWSMGYRNCVSIGGHQLTPTQVLKLEKLGVDIILAFDKDIDGDSIRNECAKFVLKDRLYIVFDKKNLLGKQRYIIDEKTGKEKPQTKTSPTDLGEEIFYKLLEKYCYKFSK